MTSYPPDFHLSDVQSRILTRDRDVSFETFSIAASCCLKLFKREVQRSNLLLDFSPSVFTLVQKMDSCTVKILLMSYNEEVLEDLVVQVEEGKTIDESLVSHICNSLNRQFRLCPGIGTLGELCSQEDVARILIEKYGDRIIFRGRFCAR